MSVCLQDEYEELLRYAVVTPKLETFASGQSKGGISQSKDKTKLQHQLGKLSLSARHIYKCSLFPIISLKNHSCMTT